MRGPRLLSFVLAMTACALLAATATGAVKAPGGETPGPIELPSPVPQPGVAVVSRTALVEDGAAAVVLRCATKPRGRCLGRLALEHRQAGGVKTVLGARTFSLASGRRQAAGVVLTRAAVALLARRGELEVTLVVAAAAPKGRLSIVERPLRLRAD